MHRKAAPSDAYVFVYASEGERRKALSPAPTRTTNQFRGISGMRCKAAAGEVYVGLVHEPAANAAARPLNPEISGA
jgi:hypothetical protein